MVCSEKYIILDNVQYRKDYFQNRCRIRNRFGLQEWLTIPVFYRKGEPIYSVSIAKVNALKKAGMKLHHYYCKEKYFDFVWPMVSEIIEKNYTHILELNMDLLYMIFAILDIKLPEIKFASELYVGNDRTERIIAICKSQGVKVFLSGWGKSNQVHDMHKLREAGICYLRLNKKEVYNKINQEYLQDGLSILDLIFKYGPQKIAETVNDFADVYKEELELI